MSTEPGPRRRGVAETTAAIERAAIDLVTEHGYDQVTVDMICQAAGISQRTFFNHFKTKDAALLGTDEPAIDQQAAREFIVSDGPLLAEAAGLVRIEPDRLPADPSLIMRRINAVSQNPVLLARQMERLTAIEDELRQIIALRLRQDALRDGADEAELADLPEQAEIVTHLLAGLMRYVGMSWARAAAAGTPPPIGTEHLAERLERVIRKLG
ncbi:TetR family transcriptional regulator [Agromyces luteolus]|uniref:TetR family transcriptional regulator n=1 Tax=Agromyces luteolus TaxID=88373 RepID=A0A7C9LX56_9MICO|nr:TetR/AcrR family transcriptional regulator [Agromyces luteolus]MUN05753.1 TetR family transcriptional regulator [Agromyces luteolus]GLK26299.1 TetR family transcriptional regulator [Agromyces luteolus]